MLLPQDFMKSMKKNHHLACNYLAFPHAPNGTYCGPHFLVESHTKILWHSSVKNAHHFLAPNIVLHTWIKILVHLTLEMMCISIYIVLQSNMESGPVSNSILDNFYVVNSYMIFWEEIWSKHQTGRVFVVTLISAHATKRCSPHLRWVLNLS